ncbi:MAG: hypothetical protein NXH81_04975 [Halieaceae bacterium]|uniref:FitA-like ribbon-helix-helix domain-containing protein n=1 Tax=Haliea alexandrii TaxID=2448162 RepID=UPI000F0BCA70|nr:plasmid stabilization protein [Haliea alexandrii]MCR9184729.1 hypothetical protein [Halieaceae bacterium]
MPTITVRNLPDEVHRALRVRAARHERSMEAEVREILAATVAAESQPGLGSLLAEMGRRVGLTEEEAAAFENLRNKSPIRAIDFE